jgi:hypothetical protein
MVRAKIAGGRGAFHAPFEIEHDAPRMTVRDLLAAVVREQLESFRRRKQEATLLRILTSREIDHGRQTGKILSGAQEEDERVPDTQQAIDAALTAFEDGFYYVFVNDAQVEQLDHTFHTGEVTDVLFIRLTPLAGG